jgi:uncharacterized protein YggE
MKTTAATLGILLLGICMAGIARADERNAPEHSVTVIAHGEIKQKPDVAYVTLFVKADALLMEDAAQDVEKKIGEIRKALKKHPEVKDVEVTDEVLGEADRQNFTPEPKNEGYHPEIVRRIRITMPAEPAKIYAMIDTATSAGAVIETSSSVVMSGNSNSIVVYGLQKPDEAKSQARRLAMADAKKQAESLAAIAEKKAGGVLRINDNLVSVQYVSVPASGQDPDYSSQNPHEIVVGVSLSVTFDLKEPK